MPTSKFKPKKYREYVKKRLSEIMPALIKIGLGNFSLRLEIPEKEDEFTELIVALNLVVEELKMTKEAENEAKKAKEAAQKTKTEALTKAKTELEKKVKERTRKLQEKVEELEKFQKFAVGRELKMIALKEEIEKLKKRSRKIKKPNNFKI